jgi:uncharacterized protein (DUF1501 family)
MQRRHFLTAFSSATGAALLAAHAPGWAQGVGQRAASAADRILVLVEFKGGNDGLNTVVPFTDSAYYQLRPVIGIKPEDVIKIDAKTGLHPELKPLLQMWEQKELSIIQGLGYPDPNLSHFRSIEIWETGSKATEYLTDGWAARGLKAGLGQGRRFTAEGVCIGSTEQGSLAGARAISLSDPEAFVNRAKYAGSGRSAGQNENLALRHLLQVEDDVNQASEGLRAEKYEFTTVFPKSAFDNGVRAAAQVIASQRNAAAGQGGVPIITLTLGSFDTHQNQLGAHAGLLKQFAEGMVALRGAFSELGVWDRTLVMTFSEFGRRARQNNSDGTDHGTVAPHFVAGGAVRGGQLYGQAPDLSRLDATQNALFTTDFRQIYATVARDWWGVKPDTVTRGRFEPIKFLRT